MHRPWLLGVGLVLVACTGDPPEETTPTPIERPEPSPYEPTVEPNEDSQLSLEQAQAALPAQVEQIVNSDPEGIRSRFIDLMSHADASCPPMTTTDIDGGTITRWVTYGQGCTSGDGTLFRGDARYGTADTVQEGAPTTGWTLDSPGFEINAPDGAYMRGSMFISVTSQDRPDGLVLDTLIVRSQLEVDPTTAGNNPWLNGTLTGDASVLGGRQATGRLLQVSAVVKPGDADAAVTATEINELQLDNVSCTDGGLSGAVAMRDVAGGWHDVFFGPEETPSCSACADLAFEGESMGQLCLSPTQRTQLLTWETTPW